MIVLRTSFGAVITIPKNEIENLSRSPAEAHDGIEMTETDTGGAGEPVAVAGELELGAALVSSTRNRHDYLSRLDLTVSRGPDQLRFQGLVDIQRADDVDLRDRQQAILSLQKEFERPYFMNLSARYLRDPTIGLRRRTSASTQLGRHIVDTDEQRLTFRAGPGFAEERRVNGDEWVTPLVGWGINYELHFTGFLERFSFRHEHEGSVDPRGRPLRLLLESETSLRYRVTDSLYLALTGSLDYDSLSPDAVETLDRRLQLRVGFGW